MKEGNYDDTNTGVLFINDKKGNQKAPDQIGNVTPVCQHCGAISKYELAAWWRKLKHTGEEFTWFKLSERRQQREASRPAPKADEDSKRQVTDGQNDRSQDGETMADSNDTEWSDDDLQTMRDAHTRVARRLFGDQRGRDWLDGEYGRLDTTLQSATRDDLLTVGRKLIGLTEAARGIPTQPSDSATVEPAAEPQPAVEDHNVLGEIAEEKITSEQVQQLETLAGQYRLGPEEFAALVRNYGADSLDQLKDANYRRLVSDILRTGGRKKAPRR